jgi:hypothetical protein
MRCTLAFPDGNRVADEQHTRQPRRVGDGRERRILLSLAAFFGSLREERERKEQGGEEEGELHGGGNPQVGYFLGGGTASVP